MIVSFRATETELIAIRINDQDRLCFRWTPAGPADVEIVDYH